MKKISFAFVFLLILSSCGNSQEKIDAAKQALLEQELRETATGETEIGTASWEELSVNTKELESGIEIVEYGQTPVLKFDTLKIQDFLDGEAEITGETLTHVDAIEVGFSNIDSLFPEDSYTLKTFKTGDARFTYRASSGFKVLDFGENIYTFRAKTGEKIVETQVIVRLPQEQTSSGGEKWFSKTELMGEENNTLLLNLPTASKYGEPLRLGETSFTYSGIKGFEAEKKILPGVNCEALEQYLSESQTSYYYWNTCRDIVKDKGIKFNLIRLQGENYIYERHYIDLVHGLYGVVELERGTWVDKESIAEKNTELKEQIFPLIEITDDLMKDIVNV